MKKEPTETTKEKKKGGKLKWIIIVVVLLVIIGAAMGGGGDSTEDPKTASSEDNPDASQPSEDEPQDSEEEADSDVPAEYRSALEQAESYGETMHMSKQGIYDQLVSEYGGQFPAEAAQYAIDSLSSRSGALIGFPRVSTQRSNPQKCQQGWMKFRSHSKQCDIQTKRLRFTPLCARTVLSC